MNKLYFEEDNCLYIPDYSDDLDDLLMQSGMEYLVKTSPEISEFE